jgi:hypothetical protein
MKAVFTNYGVADFPVVAGFDLQPAGLTFSKPITFTFKSMTHTAAYVPFTHTVNLSDNTHSIDSSITVVDNINDSLCISVVRSGSYVVEALTNWPGGLAKYSAIAGCKEGVIDVEASDKDVQCKSPSGDCQILESKVKVQFKSCNGQPIESVIVRENRGDCKVTLTLTPGASAISKNSSTSINALIKVGCSGIDAQTITMNVDGPATINPGSAQTNSEGKASATLSSGNTTGTATVTANAIVRVPVKEIIVNGKVEDAFYRKEPVNAQTSVKITDSIWHVDLALNLDSDFRLDCGCLVEHVDYSAHIEFDLAIDTVELSYAELEVPGTQRFAVTGGFCPGHCDIDDPPCPTTYTVKNINAPSSITFDIGVIIVNGYVLFYPEPDIADYDVEICRNDGCVNTHCYVSILGNCIRENEICGFSFPINVNSYTTSGDCYIMSPELHLGTYTLTVTKKETQ